MLKFPKEICTVKRKLKENEKVSVEEKGLLRSNRSLLLNVRTWVYSLISVKLETSASIELCLL